MLYRHSRLRETTTKSGLDRPLKLLVQLSFGLRRENLEIFADTIHASINEQLIQIYNSFFDFSLKYRVGIVGLERRRQSTVLDRTLQLLTQMQIRDTRFRETTTKYGLGPTFTVTSSVVLWTSTTELRNFHRRPFKRNPVAVAHVTMKKSRICIAKIKIKAVFVRSRFAI
ncbi:hypothetical protein V1477_015575 [Vespula maculifrons]